MLFRYSEFVPRILEDGRNAITIGLLVNWFIGHVCFSLKSYLYVYRFRFLILAKMRAAALSLLEMACCAKVYEHSHINQPTNQPTTTASHATSPPCI